MAKAVKLNHLNGAGLNEIALPFVNTTSRSYFGKMNSTLGSIVPLAMFFHTAHSLFPLKSSYLVIIVPTRPSVDCAKY